MSHVKRRHDETDTPSTSMKKSGAVRISGVDPNELQRANAALSGSSGVGMLTDDGNLSGAAVSAVLNHYIELSKTVAKRKGEKLASLPSAASHRSEFALKVTANPSFIHAVTFAGANAYKNLRMSDPAIQEFLPAYQRIWKAKCTMSSELLMPWLEVHLLGLELDPMQVMRFAVDAFALWDERLVTFRWHYDASAQGITVVGFSLLHPSIPSDSNFAFFPVSVYYGPEDAMFLRKQAPRTVALIEDYAKNYLDSSAGGFLVLDAANPLLRYQLFVNSDMAAVLATTTIQGCPLDEFTWQSTRSAEPAIESSLDEYFRLHPRMEGHVLRSSVGPNDAVYIFKKGDTSVFVVHPRLAPNERMIQPDWLPTRLPTDMLESVDGSLALRVAMVVPEFRLHGVKRLVEKNISVYIHLLMESNLSDKEKLDRLSAFIWGVRQTITQAANLTVTSWLDETMLKVGRVSLMSRDAKELLPHLAQLSVLLAPTVELELKFAATAKSLCEFFEVLRHGPTAASIADSTYFVQLQRVTMEASRTRHILNGAENDGMYEHMLHIVVEWERMLVGRGVSFSLFSMQAAEAYNQRLAEDIRSRTPKHNRLVVGRVKDTQKEEKRVVLQRVHKLIEDWDTRSKALREAALNAMSLPNLRREAKGFGVTGHSVLRKVVLVKRTIDQIRELEIQSITHKQLRGHPDLFEKAVRGWNLFQCLVNEYCLKAHLQVERGKERGSSSVGIWTTAEMEARLTGIHEIGVAQIGKIRDSKRARTAKSAVESASSVSPVVASMQKVIKKKKAKQNKSQVKRKLTLWE